LLLLDQAKSKEKEAGRPGALAPKNRQVIGKNHILHRGFRLKLTHIPFSAFVFGF